MAAGQVAKRLFSVAEYYRMGEAGVFGEDDRVELIEGEIFQMKPIGSAHAACVDRLNLLLAGAGGQRIIVRVQSPVRLDAFSEPEPDLSLLLPRSDYYAAAHPGPADTLLIVEVVDTSLEHDRNVKVPLDAKSGVPEVWVVDLAGGRVETYLELLDGTYTVRRVLGREASVAPRLLPDLTLRVDAILG